VTRIRNRTIDLLGIFIYQTLLGIHEMKTTKRLVKTINNTLQSGGLPFRVVKDHEADVYDLIDNDTGDVVRGDVDLNHTYVHATQAMFHLIDLGIIKYLVMKERDTIERESAAAELAKVQLELDRCNEASKEAQRHVLSFMVRDLGAETVQQWLADIQDESEAESLMGSPEIKAQVSELFKPKRK
jgi:hypothetical protein